MQCTAIYKQSILQCMHIQCWYRYMQTQTGKAPTEFNHRIYFCLFHLSFSPSGWSCRGFSSAQTPLSDHLCLPPGGSGSPCLSQRLWEWHAVAPKSPGCASSVRLCCYPARSQTPLCKQVQLGYEHLQKHKGVTEGYFARNPWHIWFIFVLATKDDQQHTCH